MLTAQHRTPHPLPSRTHSTRCSPPPCVLAGGHHAGIVGQGFWRCISSNGNAFLKNPTHPIHFWGKSSEKRNFECSQLKVPKSKLKRPGSWWNHQSEEVIRIKRRLTPSTLFSVYSKPAFPSWDREEESVWTGSTGRPTRHESLGPHVWPELSSWHAAGQQETNEQAKPHFSLGSSCQRWGNRAGSEAGWTNARAWPGGHHAVPCLSKSVNCLWGLSYKLLSKRQF